MQNEKIKERYCYYSTQCPVDILTYPLLKELVLFKNFDKRMPIEGEAFPAWGFLIYERPLTESELYNYELQPSRNNPDIQAQMEQETQVVGRWEVTYKTEEMKRITWWNPDMEKYVLKEEVLPPVLAERHWLIQEWEQARQEDPELSLQTDIF